MSCLLFQELSFFVVFSIGVKTKKCKMLFNVLRYKYMYYFVQ